MCQVSTLTLDSDPNKLIQLYPLTPVRDIILVAAHSAEPNCFRKLTTVHSLKRTSRLA